VKASAFNQVTPIERAGSAGFADPICRIEALHPRQVQETVSSPLRKRIETLTGLLQKTHGDLIKRNPK
jgi:hypothetical protein